MTNMRKPPKKLFNGCTKSCPREGPGSTVSTFLQRFNPSFSLSFSLYIYIYLVSFGVYPRRGEVHSRTHTVTKLRGRLPLREAVPLRLISRYIYIYNVSRGRRRFSLREFFQLQGFTISLLWDLCDFSRNVYEKEKFFLFWFL